MMERVHVLYMYGNYFLAQVRNFLGYSMRCQATVACVLVFKVACTKAVDKFQKFERTPFQGCYPDIV